MKLYSKPTSPYARKVRIAAAELGLADRLSVEDPPLRDASSPFWRVNPSGLVPALVTEDGELVLESNFICEYLDGLQSAPRLFPATPALRRRALRLCALGDAVISAQATRVKEGWRPEPAQDRRLVELEGERVRSVLDGLERSDLLEDALNIGHISVACGLSLSERRFPREDWRHERERIARWYDTFSRRASMTSTHAD